MPMKSLRVQRLSNPSIPYLVLFSEIVPPFLKIISFWLPVVTSVLAGGATRFDATEVRLLSSEIATNVATDFADEYFLHGLSAIHGR